jgi:hypothetical protein
VLCQPVRGVIFSKVMSNALGEKLLVKLLEQVTADSGVFRKGTK